MIILSVSTSYRCLNGKIVCFTGFVALGIVGGLTVVADFKDSIFSCSNYFSKISSENSNFGISTATFFT